MKPVGFHSTVFVLIACVLLLVAWPPRSAMALPPRPTPQPQSTARPTVARSTGGYIELTVSTDASAPADLRTVVQWQDVSGAWHDVEGWQGAFDEGNKKTWWVAKADFGKGPFRWAVTQGCAMLASSETFYLPTVTGQVVDVSVSLSSQ